MTAADRLDEIQARADKATEGPWETRLFDGLPGKKVVGKREPSDLGRGPIVLMQPIFCTEQSADNAEFIAHARADVPRLVAALRAVLDACSTYEKTQAIYRIEMGQREIIRVVRAEIEAAFGEVAS